MRLVCREYLKGQASLRCSSTLEGLIPVVGQPAGHAMIRWRHSSSSCFSLCFFVKPVIWMRLRVGVQVNVQIRVRVRVRVRVQVRVRVHSSLQHHSPGRRILSRHSDTQI